MPQLDRVIIFGQIFWLFFIFLIAYVIYTHFILSNLLKIFLVRWWKLKKDIIQITLKLRLTNLLIDTNIQLLRKIYYLTKSILFSLAKKIKQKSYNDPKLVVNDLNLLIIQISLETALYSNKSINKSSTYSYWT
uniref:ATP synthase F0 subunit 8 n=1 Tax=Pyropia perforata TaxID=182771 RepID=A0A060DDM4_PYRPE|nr:ATP synthase F0 subunit 8 [Neoporphyra perforata]AHB35396.1 ATP synthase F0 subunit 8 [Neoporphyra perforata]AHB35425.1 ATP synthase F0 subunit 8 [Neoporphyra perforata]AIB08084.1 ATP synthase F0 subunit 8 [Neoporphyra perforata]AIB08174.1 ATP synthase F0 subunit 8 [Neoporphyra perforata]